jgi:3-dehydroquinate synthase
MSRALMLNANRTMGREELEARRVTVNVTGTERSSAYVVVIRGGILDECGSLIAETCPAHRYAVISDSRVAELYGERMVSALAGEKLESVLFKFPAGEWNKTREIWSDLSDGLLRTGFGRDSVVVAVGGGVVGDLAGFVAATYMRGVPVVQIPTTLLAMVDSSVGGKTGVDTSAGKNLVGAFHQPSLVLIDPTVLGTLSQPQFIAGLAEAFKHGAILDDAYFDGLAEDLPGVFSRDADKLSQLVARSVEIKAEVVGRDEREAGYRRILNFGHTVAHAQESVSGYSWLHGEAVAVGMVLEAALGEAIGVTRPGVADRLRDVLMSARLPVELDADVVPDHLMKAFELDKKLEGGHTRFTLVSDIGAVAGSAETGWTHEVPEETLRAVLFG